MQEQLAQRTSSVDLHQPSALSAPQLPCLESFIGRFCRLHSRRLRIALLTASLTPMMPKPSARGACRLSRRWCRLSRGAVAARGYRGGAFAVRRRLRPLRASRYRYGVGAAVAPPQAAPLRRVSITAAAAATTLTQWGPNGYYPYRGGR